MTHVEYLPGYGTFKTKVFQRAFNELFKTDQRDVGTVKRKGPLAYILNEYPTVPAKGGSTKPFSDWSDQTYFIHVLNGAVIAGREF